MTKKSFLIIGLLLLGLTLISACSLSEGEYIEQNGDSTLSGTKITVYKSSSCGCCVGYISKLEKHDFNINVVEKPNVDYIKDQYNIPANMRSCHTVVVGDYFIEGHVPLEAVEKLLTEKPDVDGIALPGMPPGSPGMPGTKRGEWEIYSIKDGVTELFMRI